ncbi:MAG: HVO_0476 family zinc finger protein [Archaeoglobales archaeon]|nr:HVO_0476 family zinc finger protein [Archaeoglobales archaeon]MDI9643429.1 HVO_0476 family zinc finger protein [Archaeoglobales archaeon]
MKTEIYCETCKEFTEHEGIKKELYRCSVCGTHVHLMPEKEVELKAIFSKEDLTKIGSVKLPEEEEIIKGSELIVDLEGESRLGRITAIQLKDGKVVEFAKAKDSVAIWLKEVGEVYVKFSLHKKAITSSYKILFDGETEFAVGEEIEIEGKRYLIRRIKHIDGRLLRHEGEKAIAKEIKRVYATYSP